MISCSSIQEATLSIMLRILHVSTFWKIFFNEVTYSQQKKSGCKLSFDFAGKQRGFQKVAACIYMCKQIQTRNVFNNSIVSKVYDCYFLVPSAHDEKRVNGLPLLNMKVTLLTSLFYYTVWLTVVKTPKFTLWPDLNLTVGLDIQLTSYQTVF